MSSTESSIPLNVDDVAVAPGESSSESSILLNVEDVAVAPGECLLQKVAFPISLTEVNDRWSSNVRTPETGLRITTLVKIC